MTTYKINPVLDHNGRRHVVFTEADGRRFMTDAASLLLRRWRQGEMSRENYVALLVAADEIEECYGATA